MTLTARLAVAMVALVTLTAGAVGALSYSGLEKALLPRVLERLETHSRFIASDLESYVRSAHQDIGSITAGPSLHGMIRAHFAGGVDPVDGLSEIALQRRVAKRLMGELAAKPAYEKIRIITDDGGELIRVDRSGPDGVIRTVRNASLNSQADRAYFKDVIKLKPGELYVSHIEFSKSSAASSNPVPTVRIATPLAGSKGQLFGIAVINIDMRPALDAARSSAREGGKIYVVDERGGYLINPDSRRELSAGLRRWQEDFPDFAPLLGSKESLAKVVQEKDGNPTVVALASAILAGDEWVGVIETVPTAVSMAPTAAIQRSSLFVGLAATIFAAALAVLIARSLTGPLVKLTKAIEGFARNGSVMVPTDAKGEVGVLARAFSLSLTDVRSKTEALENEIEQHRITERAKDHHAERELLFSSAVESSNDAIITVLLDGIITSWNPAAERLFGYSSKEAIGSRIDLIIPMERQAEMHSMLARIGAGEKIEHYEDVRLRNDNSQIDVSSGISPILSASGKIIGASTIAHDISEKRRAQEALVESERMARGIIDTALDAFIQTDDTGAILNWNPQAEKIFGWSRDDVVGMPLMDLIVPEPDRAAYQCVNDHFLLTGESLTLGKRIEVDRLCSDGKQIRVESSVTAMTRRKGVVFNSFVRDLTEKLAAEDRLRQSQKMEAVGQLTGGIAHDFNNILTVITGTIEILSDAVKDDPLLASIAKMIDEAACRGAALTQHLLAFARKQPLQPRQTDINKLIVEIKKLLRPALGEHIEVESIFEDVECTALVDPNQLEMALLNLALNARDAMPSGGKLIVETGTAYLDERYASAHAEVRAGKYSLIAISDTGAGISPAVIGKVFEPFFTTKEPGKGTGLGLSMVYGFVKQSAGHIKIYSEEGHGSTVKIYLPPASGFQAIAEVTPSASARGGHETILVVEDDDLVQDYVLTQLNTLGYTTLAASNAAEAIAIIEGGTKIDLLFTDVIMPGQMNGRHLADEVRKRQPWSKILFTSGYTENAIVHHGRLDAGVHLLAKPYRKSDIARMVRHVLDGLADTTV